MLTGAASSSQQRPRRRCRVEDAAHLPWGASSSNPANALWRRRCRSSAVAAVAGAAAAAGTSSGRRQKHAL